MRQPADVGDLKHNICSPGSPPAWVIAGLATAQHGVVAHWQLVGLGLTRRQIHHRLANGQLRQVYLGVYAVGHEKLASHGRWMAAVLACGPGALLSHRDAAALWDLRKSSRRTIDVSAA